MSTCSRSLEESQIPVVFQRSLALPPLDHPHLDRLLLLHYDAFWMRGLIANYTSLGGYGCSSSSGRPCFNQLPNQIGMSFGALFLDGSHFSCQAMIVNRSKDLPFRDDGRKV
jgi:hypothetical protein